MGVQAERVPSRGTGCTKESEVSAGSWAEGTPERARGKAPSPCVSDRYRMAETTGSGRGTRIGRGPIGNAKQNQSEIAIMSWLEIDADNATAAVAL